MFNHAALSLYITEKVPTTDITVMSILLPFSRLRNLEYPYFLVSSLPFKNEQLSFFMVGALKVLDGSIFRKVLYEHDKRVTYDIRKISLSESFSQKDFLDKILNLSGDILSKTVFAYDELSHVYTSSSLPIDRAAAVLAGIVRVSGDAIQKAAI